MSVVTHTMHIFFTLVVPVVCLALLYFLGRVKPIGRFYAVLLIPPGKLFLALAELLSPFDGKRRMSESKYPGLRTIVLVIALLFAVVALAADGYNTLQALQALWPDASFSLPTLPAFFTYSMGWLFLSLPALTGMIWLEQKVELEVQLFTVPQAFQKQFERFMFLTFTLSLLASIAFNALKPSFTADNTSLVTQMLQICVFVLLGALLPLIMALTVYILALGLQAVGSLLLTSACFVSTLLADLIDFLVLDFTRAEQSIKDTHKGVRVMDRSSIVTITPSYQSYALLPQQASTVDSDVEKIVPIEPQELEETKTMNPDKNAFLSFVGKFGGHMFPHDVQAIDRLNAKESILNSYFLERSLTNVNTNIQGIHDLSHTVSEKNLSILNAATEDEADQTLLCDLALKIAEDDLHLLAIPAPFVHTIDCHKLVTAVEMLEALKKRLKLISQVVVTSVSQQDLQNKGVQTGLADCIALWQEGFLDGVVLVFSDALFPLQHGVVTRNRALAQFFVSLIIAHTHHGANPHFSSVFRECNHLSPFIGVSFASLRVAVGTMPKRFAWIPGMNNRAGSGIFSNILTECREAIDRVLTEEDTRAFPSQLRTHEPCSVLVNIPVPLNDAKFAPLARANSLHIETAYPFVQSIATVRGNGIPLPSHLNGRFLVSACALHPLQLASLQQFQGVRKTNVTTLFPETVALEPQSSNGHQAVENKKAATTKKVTSATRQKKTATSSKRIVRKNSQLAK